MPGKSIVDIRRLVGNLPKSKKALFQRIFRLSEADAELSVPPSMCSWVRGRFGSTEAVERQRIVKITNLVTCESSLFNELRSKRPVQASSETDLKAMIEGRCEFCDPTKSTAEDVFGRIKGSHCITASNIAKYDKWHGLVIFNDHNPFKFSEAKISDYLDTAWKWFRKANECDSSSTFPFFLWNCLWRAGASVVHGHAQVTMSGEPYSKVAFLRNVSGTYNAAYSGNYFDDLFEIHNSLGIGCKTKETKVMAYLTPIKEREAVIISPKLSRSFKHAIHSVLLCYKKTMSSFNMAILMPPLVPMKEWEDFPFIARIVDRGNPLEKTGDIGSVELYASSVISSDPFRFIEQIKENI